jgi:hypothetical protein
MNWPSLVGRWLGYEDVEQIAAVRTSFGSTWAQQSPGLVWLVALALAVLAVWHYRRWQPNVGVSHWWLGGLRAVVLAVLAIVLADPILQVTLVRFPQPVLWVAIDGSESLAIADDLPPEHRGPLDAAVGGRPSPSSGDRPSRADYVRAFLAAENQQWLSKLSEQFQVKPFAISTARGVEALSSDDLSATDPWWTRWTTDGSVTSLGDSLEELARRQVGDNLAGVVLISDFDQNAGGSPVEAAKRLGVPAFTLGVGPESAVDLSVDLLAPPTMKKAETSTLTVTVRQQELDQTPVTVRVWAESPSAAGMGSQRQLVGERSLVLTAPVQTVDLEYTPDQAGRFLFVAETDPLPAETITQNNRAERDVRVIDDFLRLLYVEYEPTWEWRFVKEVFHRDKLVGLRGFRTFLRSADPVVRETNELFVSNLTLPRSEFFEADVVFLGDLPASALSTRFCEMTREFVDQFGGGLVVIGGPRFGPGELAGTPLADMLPVVVDPDARRRDDREFRLQITPLAAQYDFMRLGTPGDPTADGWGSLGKLPWYQPVLRVDPRATVLAEHPTDVCADGKTRQPIIAIRPYGRGEVVYVGINELWRLRRLHGEQYYRQFWGQLIQRLGLSHALGDQKRFVVRTDRRQYRRGEEALVIVEAYDEDFQPLDERRVPERRLQAELLRSMADDAGRRSESVAIPALRPGVFETRVTLSTEGEHRLRVTDPLTSTVSEVVLTVADVSIERRNPVRNVGLQQAIASETGGKAYDLTTARQLLEDFQPARPRETTVEILSLWDTWLTFALVCGLLLVEWFGRKLVHLS